MLCHHLLSHHFSRDNLLLGLAQGLIVIAVVEILDGAYSTKLFQNAGFVYELFRGPCNVAHPGFKGSTSTFSEQGW